MSAIIATASYYYTNDINYGTKILFIGNLNNSISEEALRANFEVFGNIRNIEMNDNETFAFVEYVHKVSVLNAIKEMNGRNLNGYCLQLNFGTVLAPRCLLFDGIPRSISENYLVHEINKRLTNLKLDTVRFCLMDEPSGSALLFFKCDINKAFDTLHEFCINDIRLEVDFASTPFMFTFGDTPEMTAFKAKSVVRQKNNNCYSTIDNEQCAIKNVDNVSSNSTVSSKIHMSAKHENNNLVNNEVFDNLYTVNARSHQVSVKSSNSEMVLPTNTFHPRIRVKPLAQLMDECNVVSSYASTANCSHLLDISCDEPLDLRFNKSVAQSVPDHSIESPNYQEANSYQINELEVLGEHTETPKLAEESKLSSASTADDVEDKTVSFVDESQNLTNIEEHETKVIIGKRSYSPTPIQNAITKTKIKRKKNSNPVIKVEVDDEPFIKYESMYDKVKTRSNRNSLNLKKIKEEKSSCYYSLRQRK